MGTTLPQVERSLADEGIAICSPSEDELNDVLRGLGEILEKTDVRQHAGVDTYLAGREPVPLHTDHPEATLVAWLCEVQDTQDGASLLTDGDAVIRAMGPRSDALRSIELHIPPQLPRQRSDRAPVWDGRRLYYAPWYRVVRADTEGRGALKMFTSLLAMGFGHRRVRLQAGQLLIVDNGRWLHGRDALPSQSPRRLRRWWLRR